MSLSWDNAIAGAESKANMRGPISPTAKAPAGYATDPLAGLPEAAREKFLALGDTRADLRALALDAQDRRNEIAIEKTQAANRLATLIDPATASRDGNGFTYGPDHPSVVDAQGRMDKATAEHERASLKSETIARRAEPVGQLLNNCHRYIKQTQGQTLTAFDGMAPKLKRNETHLKAIERLGVARVKLEADLQATKAAPITATEAKATIRRQVEALAQSGAPDARPLLERGADGIAWPKRSDKITVEGTTPSLAKNGANTTEVYSRGVAFHEAPDGMALTAWLFKDTMLERLEGEIDAMSDDKNALDATERAKRETSILAAILDSERAEEFHCGLIEAEGGHVERRPDLDPRAFLGVTGPALAEW